RIITGGIGAVVFLSLVYAGEGWYSLLVLLLATIGLFEFLRMARLKLVSFPGLISYLLMMSLIWPYTTFASFFSIDTKASVPLLLPALFLLLFYTVVRKNQFQIEHAALALVGALYIGFGFGFMAATRNVPQDGFFLTVMVLLGIWSTDSGAYFVGRAIGKNKLWPAISPNKTVEGAIGGLLAGLLVTMLVNLFFGSLSFGHAALIGFVTGISAQVGDLIESAMKRHYDIKDSGRILPGHGGVLDRFDSWFVVFPLLHFFHLLG
ncbi:MAG: phosphatidate cytidylyltransferase, partial [Clostridia bacterium]